MKMKLYYVVKKDFPNKECVKYISGPYGSWQDANSDRASSDEFVVDHEIEVN